MNLFIKSSTKDSDSTGGFCYTQTLCSSSSVSALIPHCSALYCTLSIGIFKVQLLVNAFGVFRAFYRGHFSYDFRAQGVTSKSKASGNKMYISHLFTVIGYLHTAGFKNRRGIHCVKCNLSCNSYKSQFSVSQYERPRAVALASSACVDKTAKSSLSLHAKILFYI